MAADEHGFDRYRDGCRCDICRAANAAYMREYRARRRGFIEPEKNAPVTVLRTVVEDVGPGPTEQGVIDRCTAGDLVAAAQRMPDLVASCRALARILDDPRQVTTMPSAHRQLMLGVAKLETVAAASRKGRLATVAKLSQRPPSTGVAG